MYSIRPVLDFTTPAQTGVMYAVRPVYDEPALLTSSRMLASAASAGSSSGASSSSSSDASSSLQARQEAVIKTIQSLAAQADKLSAQLGVSAANSTSTTKLTPQNTRVVISASPRAQPHASLAALALIFGSSSGAQLTVHTHSSIAAGTAVSPLPLLAASSKESSPTKFHFIWSETGRSQQSQPHAACGPMHPLLIVSPRTQTIVYGDANILRYLARQFLPTLYPESDPIAAIQIDTFLALAARATAHAGKESAAAALLELNAAVEPVKSGNLVDGRITIADLAVFGALRAQQKGAIVKLTALTAWQSKVSGSLQALFQ